MSQTGGDSVEAVKPLLSRGEVTGDNSLRKVGVDFARHTLTECLLCGLRVRGQEDRLPLRLEFHKEEKHANHGNIV